MSPMFNSVTGMFFLLFSAAALLIMLDIRGAAVEGRDIAKLVRFHRICGYCFVVLLVFMTGIMVYKISHYKESLSPRVIIHVLLGFILIPFMIYKILVVRRLKKLSAELLSIGKTIFIIAFSLIAISAGYYLIHQSDIKYVSLSEFDTDLLDESFGRSVVQNKCGKCHTLERVFRAYKTEEGWTKTINKMAQLDAPNITDFDVKQLIHFLITQQKNRSETSHKPLNSEIGKSLVSQKCSICHELDRVYQFSGSKEEWLTTINRMIETMGDPEFLNDTDKSLILNYLSKRKTN